MYTRSTKSVYLPSDRIRSGGPLVVSLRRKFTASIMSIPLDGRDEFPGGVEGREFGGLIGVGGKIIGVGKSWVSGGSTP